MRALRMLAVAVAVLTAAATAPAAADEDAVPRGPTLAARIAEIQQRVQSALVYPPLAKMRRTEGVATMGFAIGADGRAKQVEVARSSGFPLLDRAAERAVRAAAPLPYVYGRLEIPVHFELEPRAPASVAASP
jgi:protein TonB